MLKKLGNPNKGTVLFEISKAELNEDSFKNIQESYNENYVNGNFPTTALKFTYQSSAGITFSVQILVEDFNECFDVPSDSYETREKNLWKL